MDIIFHVPYSLKPDANRGSGIRPFQMRQAFSEAGFNVYEISGNHTQRRAQIASLRRRINDGWRPGFVYSECATWPTGLGEKVTLDTSLTRDLRFLGFCRSKGIPTGLYYRDMYWKFRPVKEHFQSALAALNLWRHLADVRAYHRDLDVVFVQSKRMAAHLPAAIRSKAEILPPGGSGAPLPFPPLPPAEPLKLLYVGGLGQYYPIELMIQAVAATEGVRLTLCVRQEEWQEYRQQLEPLMNHRISVVHVQGEELQALYRDCHVASVFAKPTQYRQFVAPIKLFEAIGHGRPLIAPLGTASGDVVATENCGWAIPYEFVAMTHLLRTLRDEPEMLQDGYERTCAAAAMNTWKNRAQEAAAILLRGKPSGTGQA